MVDETIAADPGLKDLPMRMSGEPGRPTTKPRGDNPEMRMRCIEAALRAPNGDALTTAKQFLGWVTQAPQDAPAPASAPLPPRPPTQAVHVDTVKAAKR